MHNILLAAVRLGSDAAVWRGSEKYMLLYNEKALKNPSRDVYFLVRVQFTSL